MILLAILFYTETAIALWLVWELFFRSDNDNVSI